MSGNIKNYSKDKGFEIIPRELLQSEKLSLQAIGLLCNLQSYPEDWELHKTEVYNRFPKNKKTSVMNAWEELVEEKYIAQLRRRNGKKWDYIYYFNLEPFTSEQIKEIEENEKAKCTSFKTQKDTEILDFRFSEAQNEKPKMGSSKPESNINRHKDITHKDITHKNNTNHHQREFTDKQMSLINSFAEQNNLNDDDDDFLKLVDRLKNYKFNSLGYIANVFETIQQEKIAPKVNRVAFKANNPDWFKERGKQSSEHKEEQKNAPDQSNDQEQQNIVAKRLQNYIANN